MWWFCKEKLDIDLFRKLLSISLTESNSIFKYLENSGKGEDKEDNSERKIENYKRKSYRNYFMPSGGFTGLFEREYEK